MTLEEAHATLTRLGLTPTSGTRALSGPERNAAKAALGVIARHPAVPATTPKPKPKARRKAKAKAAKAEE